MQNRNAADKLNQQCSKLALFANKLLKLMVGQQCQLLHCCISILHLQVTTSLQSSVSVSLAFTIAEYFMFGVNRSV